MSELSELVEILQEIDYSLAQIDRDSIVSFKQSKRSDLRGDNKFNHALLAEMQLLTIQQVEQLIENKCRVHSLEKSKYSCVESDLIPILVFGKYKGALGKEVTSSIKIITTTHTNNFNSFVCGDNNGSYAVVLSDLSITKITDMLALVPLAFTKVNKLLITKKDIFRISKLTQELIDNEENIKRTTSVSQDFVFFPLYGRSPYFEEPTISTEHMKLTAKLIEYAVAFLVFHEVAHVALGHTRISMNADFLCDPTLMSEINALHLSAKGIGLSSAGFELNSHAISAYAKKKLEFQADKFALNVIAKRLVKDYPDPEDLSEEIGYLVFSISLYFLYFSCLENNCVHLRTQIDPTKSRILGKQHQIENLYFRSSHPSPYSRINAILDGVAGELFVVSLGSKKINIEKVREYVIQASKIIFHCQFAATLSINQIITEEGFTSNSIKFQGEIGDSELLAACIRLENPSD